MNAASAILSRTWSPQRGAVADIAVWRSKGKFGFVDSGLNKLMGDRQIRCVLTIRAAKVVWDPMASVWSTGSTPGPTAITSRARLSSADA